MTLRARVAPDTVEKGTDSFASASVIDAVLSGQATEAPTAPYLANVVMWTPDGTEVIEKMWRESFGIQPMPPDRPDYIVSYRDQPYCFMCCKVATQEHLDSWAHSQRVRRYVKQYPSGYLEEYLRRCIALQSRSQEKGASTMFCAQSRKSGGLSSASNAVCQIQFPHPHNPTQDNQDGCPSHSDLQS